MMQKLITAGLLALTCSSFTLSACAADSSLLGQGQVPAGYADRTVVVGADTKYINVERGDVVKFVVGDKSFSWSFTAPTTISEINLSEVAPAGMLNHEVKAYIKHIPVYDGG